MFRTIGMVLYVVGYLICALPGLLHAKLLEKNPEKHDAFCRKKVVAFARRSLKVMGVQTEVRGLEWVPRNATLTVYNHQSYLDIFVLIAYLPNTHSMVAKKELAHIPLLSDWMRAGHCLFIDRSSPRAGLAVINEAAALLARGVNVTIAPEGTRSKGGPMGEFKGGAFKIALKAEAPVLPVAIDGTYLLYEGNGNRLRPGSVTITILPPVPTAGLTKEEKKALPQRVEEQIKKVVEHAENAPEKGVLE